MNLFPKILLLSCIITSGLHCGFYEESLMEKQGMQLEITALLEVLRRCDQRDIHSLQKNSAAFKNGNDAFKAYLNEVTACELAQENLLKLMKKIAQNYSNIKINHPENERSDK